MLVLLISVYTAPYASAAESFRCDGRIIKVGLLKAEVMAKCGEPSHISKSTKTEYEYESRTEQRRGREGRAKEEVKRERGTETIINVEEWLYNFGPKRFTRILVFEDNELVEIQTGGYGS